MNDFRIIATIQKSKINLLSRTVTGTAQIEGPPDHQNDVVDFGGSKRAFSKWVGNVREMHTPKAIGKCLEWKADPLSKKIDVTVKISKGAEDTWEKILDGTLCAFSIGGHALKQSTQIDKSTGRKYNRITDYVLTELSIVDSPANPACMIVGIQKNRATDVLTSLHGGRHMAKKAAHGALRTVAKTLTDGDELIVIRKSDIEANRSDGLFVLKKDATPGVITKDDAADAGYMSDEDGADAGDMGGIDLEQHANNAANMHKDLCAMNGVDDHMQHYADATADGDEGQGGGDEQSGGSGEIEMSRRTGNLRKRNGGRPSQASIDKLIEKAVGDKLSPILAAIEDIKKSVGGGSQLQARNDATGAGAPINKTIASHLGVKPGEETETDLGGTAGRYSDLAREHAELKKQSEPLLAKQSAGKKLTEDEQITGANISKSMSRIEMEMSELRKVAAGISTS